MTKRVSKNDVQCLIEKLAGEEVEFLKTRFLAPAVRGGLVQVKMGDAICKIKVAPSDFEGFGVFEPLSTSEAILVREATLSESKSYLRLLPKVSLVACERTGNDWQAIPALSAVQKTDRKDRNLIDIDGLVPVQFAGEASRFDVLSCRFDGSMFWFDELEPRSNPRVADQMRQCFAENVSPESLVVPSMSGQQRVAYEFAVWKLLQRAKRKSDADKTEAIPFSTFDSVSERLSSSLSQAGAELINYVARNDTYNVSFRIGRRRYNSVVDQESLTVLSSGICLDGRDSDFDLNSLVGVFRDQR